MTLISRLKGLAPESVKRIYRTIRHVAKPYDAIYDQLYYDHDVEGTAAASARAMAGSIFSEFGPKTVIDVGCGTGALLEAFRDLNCWVLGLEYSGAGCAYCKKRGIPVRKFNIERDTFQGSRCDCVLSFEVAEHLPAWAANRFVDLLCRLSNTVVMSAATPGQGGRDHVNEQSHAYWVKKFAERSYVFHKRISEEFSKDWRSAGVVSWYCDNVMVFTRS